MANATYMENEMKFSELKAHFNDSEKHVNANPSAIVEIQEDYLFDISGAEGSAGGGISGGSNTGPSFNAFAQWNMSF